MTFKQIYSEHVLPKVIRFENEQNVYPERYVLKSCCVDNNALLEYLISLCEERMAMENIEVRRVTQNDAVFLQQLMSNDQIMAILHEVPRSVDVWADAIIEWDNDPDEEDYICLCEGVPIGWVGINGLSSESKHVFIKMIALLPTHQGRGIGRYVIKEMMENLRLRGFTSLELYTDLSNVRALRCYHRCGFQITEETVREMSNGTMVDRCKMELSL